MLATVLVALAVLALLGGALGTTVAGTRHGRWPVVAGLVVLAAAGTALLGAAGLPVLPARIVAGVALLLLAAGAAVPAVGDRLAARSLPSGVRVPELLGLLAALALGAAVPGVTGWVAVLAGYALGVLLPRLPTRRRRAIRPVGALLSALLAVALLAGGFDPPLPEPPAPPPAALPAPAPAAPPMLSGLTQPGNEALSDCVSGARVLQRCGRGPELARVPGWLNTPGGRPVRLAGLRGKVVLLDFWTYSCVNCQRAVRHMADWDRRYAAAGLRVIGVHSPKYDFERQRANVAAQVRKLGIGYPVALDYRKSIWNDYRNRVWPTSFLLDATGTVRHLQIGEGGYAGTESLIRTLLRAADPDVVLPPRSPLPDDSPAELAGAGDNYLNYFEVRGYAGTPLVQGRPATYRFGRPVQQPGVSLDGTWTVTTDRFDAGRDARLALRYRARSVNLVLGGTGSVVTTVDGGPAVRTDVSGEPRIYPVISDTEVHGGRAEFAVSPGLRVYEVITE